METDSDGIYNFYVGMWDTFKDRIEEARRTGAQYYAVDRIYHEICLGIPTKRVSEMVRFCDGKDAKTDRAINAYVRQNGLKVYVATPSLVDHRDEPSLHPYNKGRHPLGAHARWFIGEGIPRHIHQMWIGDKMRPATWMGTWVEKNPNFGYTLWDEKAIADFGLKNKKLYDRLCGVGCWNGASDVVRAEVLERLGGIYIDADTECVQTLQGAPFLEHDFFAVYSPNFPDGAWIATGIMGAMPGHPAIAEYVAQLGRVASPQPAWRMIGAGLFNPIFKKHKTDDDIILPAYTFLQTDMRGREFPAEGAIYGKHYWGSTHKSYDSH